MDVIDSERFSSAHVSPFASGSQCSSAITCTPRTMSQVRDGGFPDRHLSETVIMRPTRFSVAPTSRLVQSSTCLVRKLTYKKTLCVVKPNELTPGIPSEEYERRRAALMDTLPGDSIVVSVAAPIKYMSNSPGQQLSSVIIG